MSEPTEIFLAGESAGVRVFSLDNLNGILVPWDEVKECAQRLKNHLHVHNTMDIPGEQTATLGSDRDGTGRGDGQASGSNSVE